MKPTLLYSESHKSNLFYDYCDWLLKDYFDLEIYDQTKTYDIRKTVVVIRYVGAEQWAFDLQQQGFKIVVDNLWEPYSCYLRSPGYDKLDPALTHQLHTDVWFWLHESLANKSLIEKKSLEKYHPRRTFKKLAFMPMRLSKYHRDWLLNTMRPFLNDFYYSYQSHGIMLPGDRPFEEFMAQRYFNPVWYDDTYFSMVSESMIDQCNNDPLRPYLGTGPFITEKTFKPILYQHPFMIHGHSNTIGRLKELGFESFSNLFDESYDVKGADKLSILKNNVANFERNPLGYDQETLDKIQHNYNLFTNQSRIINEFVEKIINPLLEYAETQT